MSKVDRIIVASFMMMVLFQYWISYNLIDRTDSINQAIKTLASATLETKMHCDESGERTDDLWEEVFDVN